MRPIDAALEVLVAIADNDGQVPQLWIQQVLHHELSPDMSLERHDLAVIVRVLQMLAPCRFLEIGAGSSTPVLFGYNPNGLNISLEDSSEWVANVRPTVPGGTGIVLKYDNFAVENPNVLRADWRAKVKKIAGYDDAQLRVPYHLLQKRAVIPDWLWSIEFDVILVDGPFGFGPGRSGTTLLASRLSTPTSVVFVDDAVNRPHEMEKVLGFMPDRYPHSFAGGRLTMLV